jgi:mannitol/fructose-specific phosphotransferase system IIA component (Ntr-type)
MKPNVRAAGDAAGVHDMGINFRQTLEHGCFSLDLKSTNKAGVIAELIDLLVSTGQLKDGPAALRAVLDREARMSTGMQHGVAVPHGKTATVDRLVTAFGMKREGVDFQALDGQPCRIFVMTISPVNRTGPHIQYLSEISKFLDSPAIRDRLLAATTVQEVLDILS